MFHFVCATFYLLSVDFINELRSLRKRFDTSSPTVVHCSAGVGRSGVVALTEMLMDKVDIGEVNIPSIIKHFMSASNPTGHRYTQLFKGTKTAENGVGTNPHAIQIYLHGIVTIYTIIQVNLTTYYTIFNLIYV